jgi:threonine dehydrogenase-like Zn-dependent dehydrogenase
MPANLTYEEAATLPVVFMTAWHALKTVAHMKAGETILVHAGAGGVGMAAIQIAHHLGAEVIASAGSSTKRSLLKLLGVKHVIDSRKGDFTETVLELTQGRGVDVVLNALAADNDRVQNNKAIRAAIEGLTDAITNAVAQFKDVDDAHDALVASYTNMAANIDLMVAAINARPAPSAYIATNTVAAMRNIQSTNNATFNAVRDAGQKIKQYGQDVRAYSVQDKQAQKAALQSLRDIAAQLKALMRNEIDR